jgi:molecular chaperone GrpE (heat shock protein)
MVPGAAVGKEEVLELKNELKELKEAGYKFKKEFQEYKAKIEEREKWIHRFWKERVTYISIIVGLVVGLVTIAIMLM